MKKKIMADGLLKSLKEAVALAKSNLVGREIVQKLKSRKNRTRN